jgi:tetratricopeptide (TPR) repeat protein
MRRILSLLAAAMLAAAPLGDAAAWAAQPLAGAASRQETADAKAVQAAIAAYSQQGFQGLEKHLPALRKVLERAPSTYPKGEERDGVLILRGDGTIGVGLVGEGTSGDGRKLPVRTEFNTYPMAALMLATYAVEKRRPTEALPALDRGLALQPEHAMLVSEKAMALGLLERRQEAVDIVERWLRETPKGDPADRARMLRSKGFNLIELKRLDEAEAAFRDSLKLEPNHALARNELEYIRRLRAGGPQAPVGLITSNKAATDIPIPD